MHLLNFIKRMRLIVQNTQYAMSEMRLRTNLTGNYPHCGSFSTRVCEGFALAPASPALPGSQPPPAKDNNVRRCATNNYTKKKVHNKHVVTKNIENYLLQMA